MRDMSAQSESVRLAFSITIGLGILLPAGHAAPTEAPAPAAMTAGQPEGVRLGLVTGTRALIGAKVRDCHDATRGRMEDILLDLSSGQAVAALCACGSDSAVTPVPARIFSTTTRNQIMLSADKKTFKSAPCLPAADLGRGLELGKLSQSFTYFSQKLPEIPAGVSGRLSSAAALAGQRLLGRNSEPLGQVEDILVDLPVGRLVYLLIQPSAGGQAEGALYAVPPQAVRPDAAGQALVLEADQAHFLAGPHFQAAYRTDVSRPDFAAAVQQHYARPATPPAGASAPAQPTASCGQGANAAALEGSPKSDQEVTKAVMTEIVRTTSLFPIRGLKISASNGRVTLAGYMKSEKRKQQLLAAAARVVGPENVIFQPDTLSKR